MIDEHSNILKDFESRFVRFFEVLDVKKKENQILLKEKENLLSEVEIRNTKIKVLEKKIDLMKLATSMQTPNGDVHDAKIMINRLVREIDNCIALLNK